MYSIDEKKQIRKTFWSKFKTNSNGRKLKAGKPGKWIMEQTGIRQIKLKFHFDENHAWAGIEVDSTNLDKRIHLFDKLEKLKKLLTEAVPHPLIWELEEAVTDKKTVSRIYAIVEDVNIYDKNCWRNVNRFFYDVMDPIEDMYREYFDFLKYQ